MAAARLPLTLIALAIAAGIGYLALAPRSDEPPAASPPSSSAMRITSPSFENNAAIPARYTCDGENIHPPLTVSGVPANAKSLMLIVDDPDAPRGVWVHWTVWNIDPTTREITERSVPAGAVEGKTSFGKSGYGGPCPPSGTHRYFFKLFALDATLDLPPETDAAGLERAMEGHILDRAELMARYRRG